MFSAQSVRSVAASADRDAPWGYDLETAPQQVAAEVRAAHARLLEKHRRVAGVYAEPQWRGPYYDYDTAGEGHHRFHPDGLPDRKELLPLSKFGTDEDFLKHAQRRFSSAVHHASWLKLLTDLQSTSVREAVRFIAVSQGHRHRRAERARHPQGARREA